MKKEEWHDICIILEQYKDSFNNLSRGEYVRILQDKINAMIDSAYWLGKSTK